MNPSPRHSKCGRSSNVSDISFSAWVLPSGRTTRVYWFSISQRPSRICCSSMCTDARMSSGSNPATTIGFPYTSDTNRYGRVPTTVDTWPGPRNPDSRRSGDSRMALIGGTIVTWLQNTLKLLDPERARPHQRDRGRRRGRLEADREEHHVAVGVVDRDLERVERGVHEPDVGAARLRLDEVAPGAGHPHHVAEGREDDARLLGQPHRVVDAAHRDHAHRAARPVHQLNGFRQQVLDAVPVDGVRVPAAHLHELELVIARQLGDGLDQSTCGRRVPEFVDELHAANLF